MLGRLALTNKMVAQDLGKDEKVVESVTSFFFKEMEREMREANHPFLYVKGLGTFVLNKGLLERRIRYLLCKVHRNRRGELEGKVNIFRESFQTGMKREIYYLLQMRRRLKNQWKKNNGKSLDDTSRESLQTFGKDGGPVSEEIQGL